MSDIAPDASPAHDAALVAAMVDSSPDPVFAIRPSGRLIFANASLRAILGIEQSDLGAVNIFDHIPPQAIEVVQPMLDEMLSSPPGTARYDERSEEHTSELQSQPRISYAVFCLKQKQRL